VGPIPPGQRRSRAERPLDPCDAVPSRPRRHASVVDARRPVGEGPNLEIIRVGLLTTPPENKAREVFAGCDTAARGHVGDDRHEGRLGLAVIVPSTDEWIAGAREYRCALFEFAADGFTSRMRTGEQPGRRRGE
jgi:hypothetical protein